LRHLQSDKEKELTEYQRHCRRWQAGCGAEECSMEGVNRVFARGSLPCDVLLCGEAPGESENSLLVPFIGVAGKLLDQVVAQATWALETVPDASLEAGSRPWTWAMTNVVACIPRTEDGGYDEPSDEQIRSCQPRLEEMIRIAAPRIIVRVGKVAQDWIDGPGGYKHALRPAPGIKLISFEHPARILRMSEAQKGLAIQRCVVTLVTTLREVFGGK
jgi:uracil-DNA glycosylase family 4